MKRGRYNIQLPNGEIKKYNVYLSDNSHYYQLWIYYKKEYVKIEKKERYRGGWLWKLKKRIPMESLANWSKVDKFV